MRLWKYDSGKLDQIESIRENYINYTEVKIDAQCLNLKDEDETKIIDELDVTEEDIILVELPKGEDIWTFAAEGQQN